MAEAAEEKTTFAAGLKRELKAVCAQHRTFINDAPATTSLARVMQKMRAVPPFGARLCMSQTTPAAKVMQEFDTEFLLHAPEIYIFSACRHILELIVAARASSKSGKKNASASDKQVTHLLSQLRGLAQATERFDIVAPFTPGAGFSLFFWRWYNWWYDYRQGLTADELDHVHRLQEAVHPGALGYRPPGHWLTYRATPPFRLKRAFEKLYSLQEPG